MLGLDGQRDGVRVGVPRESDAEAAAILAEMERELAAEGVMAELPPAQERAPRGRARAAERSERPADILAERAAQRNSGPEVEPRRRHQRRRSRSRRRRRRRDSPSDSESGGSDSEEGGGRDGRRRGASSSGAEFCDAREMDASRPAELARRLPGALLQRFLSRITEYLAVRTGDEGEALPPVVMQYLTTFLAPSLGDDLSLRNGRELRTIATTLDALLRGRQAEAADLLVQRFKAVELAATEGTWAMSEQVELVPESRVSSMGTEERAHVARREQREAKSQQLVAGFKGGENGEGRGRRGDRRR